MAWNPHEIVPDGVAQLARKYDGPVHDVLKDFLQIVHEAIFKSSTTEALHGIYLSLGPEAAWHFWGMLYKSYCQDEKCGYSMGDARSLWHETALRMDGRMKRFACVLDRWSEERDHELEQEQLEREVQNEHGNK